MQLSRMSTRVTFSLTSLPTLTADEFFSPDTCEVMEENNPTEAVWHVLCLSRWPGLLWLFYHVGLRYPEGFSESSIRTQNMGLFLFG